MGSNDRDGEDAVYGYVDMFKQMGDERPAHIYLLQTRKVKIGREHRCDIRLHSLRVSRLQCCLRIVKSEEEGPRVFLQNLSSKATTKYKGIGILQNGQVELTDGDRFQLHDIELRYRAFDFNSPNAQPEPISGHPRVPVIRLRAADRAVTPEGCNDDDGSPKTSKTDKPKSPRVSAKTGRLNKSLGSAGGSGELSAKRRKSSEIDMRKAVLKKTFRSSVQGIKFPQIAETVESSSIKANANGCESSEVPIQDGDLENTEVVEDVDVIEEASVDIETSEIVDENDEEDLILLSPLVEQETTEKNISGGVEGEDLFKDIEREMFVLHHGDAIGTQEEEMDISSPDVGEDNADTETQQLESDETPTTLHIVTPAEPDLILLVQNSLPNSIKASVEASCTHPESVPSSPAGLLKNRDISVVGPAVEISTPLTMETPSKSVLRDVSLFDGSATTAKTFCTAFGDEDQCDLTVNTTAKTNNDIFFDAEQDDVENLDDIFENSTTSGNKSNPTEIDSDIEEIPLEESDFRNQLTQRISPRGSPTKSPSKSPLKSPGKSPLKSPSNSPVKVTHGVDADGKLLEEHDIVDLESNSPSGVNVSIPVPEFIDLDDSSSDNITGDKSDERLLTGTVPLNLPSIDSEEIIELDQEADLLQNATSSEGSTYTLNTTAVMGNKDSVEISDGSIRCENQISQLSEEADTQMVLQENVADFGVDNSKASSYTIDISESTPASIDSCKPSSDSFTGSKDSTTRAEDNSSQNIESTFKNVTSPASEVENQILAVEDHAGEGQVLENTPKPHEITVVDAVLESTPARVLRTRRATSDSVKSETVPPSTPRRGRRTKNLVETPKSMVKQNALITPRRRAESSPTQLTNADKVRSGSVLEEQAPKGTSNGTLPNVDIVQFAENNQSTSEASKIVELGRGEQEKEKYADSEEGNMETGDENIEGNDAVIVANERESPDDAATDEVAVVVESSTGNEVRVETVPAQCSTDAPESSPASRELEGSSYFAPTCTSDIEDDLESVVSMGGDVQKERPLAVQSSAKIAEERQDVEAIDLELLENKENHNISKNKDELISEKEVTKRTQRQTLVESDQPKPTLRDCSVVLQRIIVHVVPYYSSDEEEDTSVKNSAEVGVSKAIVASTSIAPESPLLEPLDEIHKSKSSPPKEICSTSATITETSASTRANDEGSEEVEKLSEGTSSKYFPNSSAMSSHSDEENGQENSKGEISSASPSRAVEKSRVESMDEDIEPEHASPEAVSPEKLDSSSNKSAEAASATNQLSDASSTSTSAKRSFEAKNTPKSTSFQGRIGRKTILTDEEPAKKERLHSSRNSSDVDAESNANEIAEEDNPDEIPDSEEQDNLITDDLPGPSVKKQTISTPILSRTPKLLSSSPPDNTILPKSDRISKPFASTPKQSESTPVTTPTTIKNCSIILQRVNVSNDLSTPITTRSRNDNFSAKKATPAVASTSSASFGTRTRLRTKVPSTPAKDSESIIHSEDKVSAKQTPANRKALAVASTPKSNKKAKDTKAESEVSDNDDDQRTSTLAETPAKGKTPRKNNIAVTPGRVKTLSMKAVEIVELEVDDNDAKEITEKTRGSTSDSKIPPERSEPESDTSSKGRRGRRKNTDEGIFVKPKSPLKKLRRGRMHVDEHESDSSSSASSTRSTRGRRKIRADVVTIDDDDNESEKEESSDEHEIRKRRGRPVKKKARKIESESENDDKVDEGQKTSDSESVNDVEKGEVTAVKNVEDKHQQAPAKSKRGRARVADALELENKKIDIPTKISPKTKPKGRRGRRPKDTSEEDDVEDVKTGNDPEPVPSSIPVERPASPAKATRGNRKGNKQAGKNKNQAKAEDEVSKSKLTIPAILPATQTVEASTSSKAILSKVETDEANTSVKLAHKMAGEPFVKIIPLDVTAATTTRSTRHTKAVEVDEQVTAASSSRKPKRQKVEIESPPKPDLSTETKETKVRGRGGKKVEVDDKVKPSRSHRGRKNETEGMNNLSDVDDGTESDHTKTKVSSNKATRGNARRKQAAEEVITLNDESDEDDGHNQMSSPEKQNVEAAKAKPSNRSKRGRKNTVEENEKDEEEPKAKRGRHNTKGEELAAVDEPKSKKTRMINGKKPLVAAKEVSDNDEEERDEETESIPSRNRNRYHAKNDNLELEKPKTKPTTTKRSGRGNVKHVESSVPEESENEAEEEETVVSKTKNVKSRGRKKIESTKSEEGGDDVKKPAGRRRVLRNGNLPEPKKVEELQNEDSDAEDDQELDEKLPSSPMKKPVKGSQNKKTKPIPSTSSSKRTTRVQVKQAVKNDESSDESEKQPTNRNKGKKKVMEKEDLSESESEIPSDTPQKASKGRGRTRKEVQEKDSKSKTAKSNSKNGSSPRVVLQLPITAIKGEPEIVDLLSDDEDDVEPEKPTKRLRYTAKEGSKPNPVSKPNKTKAARRKQK